MKGEKMTANDVLERCKSCGIMPTMVVRHGEKGVFTIKTYDPEVAKVEAMLAWGVDVEELENMTVAIRAKHIEKAPDVI